MTLFLFSFNVISQIPKKKKSSKENLSYSKLCYSISVEHSLPAIFLSDTLLFMTFKSQFLTIHQIVFFKKTGVRMIYRLLIFLHFPLLSQHSFKIPREMGCFEFIVLGEVWVNRQKAEIACRLSAFLLQFSES